MRAEQKRAHRIRRHKRVRKHVSGTAERPRLAVFRSNRHIYAQLVDNKTARARQVGKALAERAKSAGLERAVFDRGGRLYHGRVQALAEGAREGGLEI